MSAEVSAINLVPLFDVCAPYTYTEKRMLCTHIHVHVHPHTHTHIHTHCRYADLSVCIWNLNYIS